MRGIRWPRWLLRLLLAGVILGKATTAVAAEFLLVPMDLSQSNHLRAYGHAYHALQAGSKVTWRE